MSPLEYGVKEGENPVLGEVSGALCDGFEESSCLGMQLKLGGRFLLKLNIGERPIANKYREGKMKSTLERELTVREIVEKETLEVRRVQPCSAFWCIHGDRLTSVLRVG
jgi:hypothetical protein